MHQYYFKFKFQNLNQISILYQFEYKPNYLIADAAPAIHNGFMLAFDYKSLDEFIRVMCWSHFERNCEEKSNGIETITRDADLADIKLLQTMPSTSAFNHAVKLFFEKSKDRQDCASFLSHFCLLYLDSKKLWLV